MFIQAAVNPWTFKPRSRMIRRADRNRIHRRAPLATQTQPMSPVVPICSGSLTPSKVCSSLTRDLVYSETAIGLILSVCGKYATVGDCDEGSGVDSDSVASESVRLLGIAGNPQGRIKGEQAD